MKCHVTSTPVEYHTHSAVVCHTISHTARGWLLVLKKQVAVDIPYNIYT